MGATQIDLQRRIASLRDGFTSQSGKSISDAAALVHRRPPLEYQPLGIRPGRQQAIGGEKQRQAGPSVWPSGHDACSKTVAICQSSCWMLREGALQQYLRDGRECAVLRTLVSQMAAGRWPKCEVQVCGHHRLPRLIIKLSSHKGPDSAGTDRALCALGSYPSSRSMSGHSSIQLASQGSWWAR